MFNLDLEKAEKAEVKLPKSIGSEKKQKKSRKTSVSLTMLKPLTVWITTNYGKFFKRWEYQTTLPASWEICMQVKKQQLEPDMGKQTGSNVKGIHQCCILSPCLFNVYADYIKRKTGLDESQDGTKTVWRNINNFRYKGDTTLMAESKEELKGLLIKVKNESEKADLNSTFKKQRSWHPIPSLYAKYIWKQ